MFRINSGPRFAPNLYFRSQRFARGNDKKRMASLSRLKWVAFLTLLLLPRHPKIKLKAVTITPGEIGSLFNLNCPAAVLMGV